MSHKDRGSCDVPDIVHPILLLSIIIVIIYNKLVNLFVSLFRGAPNPPPTLTCVLFGVHWVPSSPSD